MRVYCQALQALPRLRTQREKTMREPTIAELKAEIKARKEFEKCLCPKCAHFRAVYPIWGAYTECDRSGEWREQDWRRKKCKSYEPK